jgi:hypothetical protein
VRTAPQHASVLSLNPRDKGRLGAASFGGSIGRPSKGQDSHNHVSKSSGSIMVFTVAYETGGVACRSSSDTRECPLGSNPPIVKKSIS